VLGKFLGVKGHRVEEARVERKEYEIAQEDLDKIREASKPVPYLLGAGGVAPTSPQERANAAWEALGSRMGFQYMTARPAGKGDRFFTAVPVMEAEE